MKRYLETSIAADLRKKMVFVARPRQVGKTTLARHVAGRRGGYLNWDVPADRSLILQRQHPPRDPLVLDEIHKFRG